MYLLVYSDPLGELFFVVSKWYIVYYKFCFSLCEQFEKATQIHSIDIGNESSAFVEVLVGHATSNSPDDYQVIF